MESKKTALVTLHHEFQAKMVEFAGYRMPMQYRHGIIHEHQHTRTRAGLFDISHMGQIVMTGPSVAERISQLTPTDLTMLQPGQQKYTVLTNSDGGIIDDLVVTRLDSAFLLIVNAVNKAGVVQYLQDQCGHSCTVDYQKGQALLALQGPLAETVLKDQAAEVTSLRFMESCTVNIEGIACRVSRSGYTGEDGFEIVVPNAEAEALARRLLSDPNVEWVGLGARDTLRLEAGLCLYGNELDVTTTPIEAGLSWLMTPGHDGYPGADIIKQHPCLRRRVGLIVSGKIPVRKGAVLYNSEDQAVGQVTSGSFGPTIGGPIAMAYIGNQYTEKGTQLFAQVRNKLVELVVTGLPFVRHRYCRN